MPGKQEVRPIRLIAILGGMESEPSAHVPAIYVAKYNRFVDNILGKINNILRANYEPVTVKLTNPSSNSKSSKSKNKFRKKGNKNGTKKSAPRPDSTVTERSDNENVVEVCSQDVDRCRRRDSLLKRRALSKLW